MLGTFDIAFLIVSDSISDLHHMASTPQNIALKRKGKTRMKIHILVEIKELQKATDISKFSIPKPQYQFLFFKAHVQEHLKLYASRFSCNIKIDREIIWRIRN